MTRKQLFLEVISSLIIMLFLYASVSKFLGFPRFIHEMNNQPLPRFMKPFLIWGLPPLEVLISVALVFERTRKAGLYASLILMGLFTVYACLILFHFFRYVPCSCGGVIRNLTWQQHLVLNLFFVGIAIAGVIIQRKLSKSNQYSSLKTLSYEKG